MQDINLRRFSPTRVLPERFPECGSERLTVRRKSWWIRDHSLSSDIASINPQVQERFMELHLKSKVLMAWHQSFIIP
jgi:hypothetical protein